MGSGNQGSQGGGADAVVVGAGVIGLTSAIRLTEAGLRVRVVAAAPPLSTTSALATAMIGPSFGLFGDQVDAWEAATWSELTTGPDQPGVRVCRGRFATRTAGMIPPTADRLSGYAPLGADELPAGFAEGFWADNPLVDMPVYLRYLADRFAGLGGVVEIREVDSLAALAGEAPWVVNCAGLGARELAGDDEVTPVRGPWIVVANPGVDTFFIEGPPQGTWASYHPHGDHVVLGGSTEGTAAEPDTAELRAIVARCAEVEPRLAEAVVLAHEVGFRPGRPSIRLEEEQVGTARCVHNYGHGGIGVSVAWGCADEVAGRVAAG